MRLMIVESPNKVAKIKAMLGEGWDVAASVGHVRDLPERSMGLSAPDFALQYTASERGAKVIAKLRPLAAAASRVVLATDPDREGEAIAWHVLDALGLDEARCDRVTFNAIEATTIRAALDKPRKIDMALVHAQEARRALDRLVGYMVSPVLWDSHGSTVSAGRVQSPAVRLVVDREAQIAKFKPTHHFGAVVSFDEGRWSAHWDTKPHLADDDGYVLDKPLAEQAAACRNFTVTASASQLAKDAPPAPYCTSTLLQAASVSLGLNPEQSMALAQALFEQGLISYHRTDALNLSDPVIAEIRQFAAGQGWPVPEAPRRFKEKADAQAAHEGIRPTHITDRIAGAKPQEQALYRLIWDRAVASQLGDATYRVNTATLTSVGAAQPFVFLARGRQLIDAGWRALTADDATTETEVGDTDDTPPGGAVPVLSEGASVQAVDGKVLSKVTKPPPRYSQAGLVKKLESLGIGRPSTYAAVIKNIMERGYIVEDKRKLVPAPLGVDLIGSLCKAQFAFIEFDYTRKMEVRLDDVASGRDGYRSVVGDSHSLLTDEIQRVKASGALPPRFRCPVCSKALQRRTGTRGVFWSCAGFEQGCPVTMDDAKGTPVARKSFPCPACEGPMHRIKGEHGFFWGCAAYKAGCKTTLPDERGKPGKPVVVSKHVCPECAKPLVHRTKVGKAGFDFWGCTGYPGCKQSFKTGLKGEPVIFAKT